MQTDPSALPNVFLPYIAKSFCLVSPFPRQRFSIIIIYNMKAVDVREVSLLAKQRIGILGGAFDPVHDGHLAAARLAAESARLDQVLIMPTGDPGYKKCVSDAEDRWKMLVAACRGDKALVPCRLELDRVGPIYTADTLPLIRDAYPDAAFFVILGADAFLRLRRWKRSEEILRKCRILVCSRPDEAETRAVSAEAEFLRRSGARIQMLPLDGSPFSSGAIRAALAESREPAGLDLCVREYIESKGLYDIPGRIPESSIWLDRLFAALKPHRFAHSLAVAAAARKMAIRFGEDPLKAEKAGLLHDCAKHMSLAEMQRIARDHHLAPDEAFLSSSSLLHSVVGAWVAEAEYGMADPEILDAIAYHNTGHAGMSRLAMCVCLSDSIEPTRSPYPLLEEIRAVADSSLEKALLLSLESTAGFVTKKGAFLHPRTRETITWLKTLPCMQEA